MASTLKTNGFKKSNPKKAPSFMVKFMSLFNAEMKGMLPFVDAEVSADISPTKRVFNWKPISFEKTLIDSAKSVENLS
jgi:dihydroflavonol-4-reductase